MYIYIDESGIFRNPANKVNTMSCVSALVIPTSQRREIFKKFKRLLSKFPPAGAGKEIKGSQLNEEQIAQVISLLQRYEVILDTICIDLGLHTEEEITEFKRRQADSLIAHLTSEHQPSLIEQAHEQREYVLRMPIQLFGQAFLLWSLIPRLFQKVIWYYSTRIPRELGKFNWVVDAKDIRVTEFEESWSTVIYPLIYTHSLKEPLMMIEGGDYSYLERFKDDDQERLQSIRGENNLDDEYDTLSIAKILGESLTFDATLGNLGLQLVDILANATQRGLNSKLARGGWENIGALMLAQGPAPIRVISLNTVEDIPGQRIVRGPAFGFIEEVKRKAKPILEDQPK